MSMELATPISTMIKQAADLRSHFMSLNFLLKFTMATGSV